MSDTIVSYAALILADAGLEVSADNLLSLSKAAGASVDNVWAEVYSTALEGKDLKEILSGFHNVGSAAAAPAAAGGEAAGGEAAEEKPQQEEEESDDDMGMGLFD